MFLTMLKDEFPDVRLNIISKLELVNNGTFVLSQGFLAVLTIEKLSASTVSHNLSYPQSFSSPKTSNGECD